MTTRRLANYLDLFRYHRQRSAGFAEHDYRDVYLATRRRLENALGRTAEGLRMLDVGCGQRFPASLLFAAAGNEVTGIDTERVVSGPGLGAFVRIWRSDGLERAAKSMVRQLLFDPTYYRRLAELVGGRLPRRALDIRQLSITRPLPFEDGTFDAIISNAVFEHLPDVPAAIGEVTRLLKPGGVCHIAVHLFPSISGGHHMRWAFPDEEAPEDVPPWDHLRERRFPAHVYLNQLDERAYREAFEAAKELEVIDWITTRTEGERFLTPAIMAELADRYTRDDLVKREIVVVARRRAAVRGASDQRKSAR